MQFLDCPWTWFLNIGMVCMSVECVSQYHYGVMQVVLLWNILLFFNNHDVHYCFGTMEKMCKLLLWNMLLISAWKMRAMVSENGFLFQFCAFFISCLYCMGKQLVDHIWPTYLLKVIVIQWCLSFTTFTKAKYKVLTEGIVLTEGWFI